MKHLICIILSSLIFISCKKDAEIKNVPAEETGFLEIHVNNKVGQQSLLLTNYNYTLANGDTFSVDLYKYYISNIQLENENGTVYAEPESYYLIDQSNPASMHLMVKGVPQGNYTSISFLMGVDHPRNIAGAQTGALDPANDMFWDWNTGYIMAKLEGHSPQSTELTHKIAYHIGGHIGKNNALRTVNLSFPNTANCTKLTTPTVTIDADLAKWFVSPNFTDFANMNVVTGVTFESNDIANNYAAMFSLVSVVN